MEEATRLSNLVVFIHIGNTKPKHLLLNLDRVRHQLNNTKINVLLIATNEELLREAQDSGYLTQKYETDLEIEGLFASHSLSHDHTFRDGFWRFSIERLFAFTALFEKFKDVRALHLESDILTLQNFPYQRIFKSNYTMWCKFNENVDVGSLLYIPSQQQAIIFKNRLIQLLEKETFHTDMTALNALATKFLDIKYFPIAESETSEYLNSANISENSMKRVTEIYSSMQGIFDPAQLGMYYLGQDPRNNWGFTRRRIVLPHSAIFTERIKLMMDEKNNLFTDRGIRVYCLHVHSKDIKLFSIDGEHNLKKIVQNSKTRSEQLSFSLMALLEIIADYRKRKQLISLVLNIPVVKKIRSLKSLKNMKQIIAKNGN